MYERRHLTPFVIPPKTFARGMGAIYLIIDYDSWLTNVCDIAFPKDENVFMYVILYDLQNVDLQCHQVSRDPTIKILSDEMHEDYLLSVKKAIGKHQLIHLLIIGNFESLISVNSYLLTLLVFWHLIDCLFQVCLTIMASYQRFLYLKKCSAELLRWHWHQWLFFSK